MKKNEGITMITLVVTVIVLIILAGVSLNTTIGENGIISQAQKARENIELARVEEEKQLNSLYEELENNGQGIVDDSNIDAIEKLKQFKQVIATAITNEGVATAQTDTAETMANHIGKILKERTKDATATTNDILVGKTAWVNGNKLTGVNKGYEVGYEEGYQAGQAGASKEIIYLGAEKSYDIKTLYPEIYSELTEGNFIVEVTSCRLESVPGGKDATTSSTTTVTKTGSLEKSYDNVTGIFTCSLPNIQTVVFNKNAGNWGVTSTASYVFAVYLVR